MNAYSRRELLQRAGQGIGAMALASMLPDNLRAAIVNPLAPKPAPLPARAKAVIHLFMHGGVSHVDTFDPKPELAKRDGQTISAEMAKGLKTNRIDFARAPMRGSPWKFQKHGQSGMEISELYPGIASKADEIALIRSCYGDAFDHAPGMYLKKFRVAVSGATVYGVVGDVWPGFGEPKSARICGDVGWCHEVGAGGLQRGLSACCISGDGIPRGRSAGVESGITAGHRCKGAA